MRRMECDIWGRVECDIWARMRLYERLISSSPVSLQDIAAELKLPPVKLHCSMLAEDAIKAAIKDYKSKQGEKSEGEAAP